MLLKRQAKLSLLPPPPCKRKLDILLLTKTKVVLLAPALSLPKTRWSITFAILVIFLPKTKLILVPKTVSW